MSGELATGPLPACRVCKAGDHEACIDLYHHPTYGLIACDCDVCNARDRLHESTT